MASGQRRGRIRSDQGWAALPEAPEMGTNPTVVLLNTGHVLAVWADVVTDSTEDYLGSKPRGVARGSALPCKRDQWRRHRGRRGAAAVLAGRDVARTRGVRPAHSFGPTIGFVSGKVCVAWAEAADQEPVLSVRCHDEAPG